MTDQDRIDQLEDQVEDMEMKIEQLEKMIIRLVEKTEQQNTEK